MFSVTCFSGGPKARTESGSPCAQPITKRAILDIVIWVMMDHEDRSHSAERNSRVGEGVGHTETAIDRSGFAITQDHMRSHMSRAAGQRASTGAEQHSLVPFAFFSAPRLLCCRFCFGQQPRLSLVDEIRRCGCVQ